MSQTSTEQEEQEEQFDGPFCPMCDGGHGGSFCPLEDQADYSGEPWWAQ